MEERLAPLASLAEQRSASDWSVIIKEQAGHIGTELVGITEMYPQWVFEGLEVKQ